MPEVNKEDLKLELGRAKETIRIKDQTIRDLEERISRLRAENKALFEDKQKFQAQIDNLNRKIQDLQGKLDTLQKERPKLTPENLLSSFKTALIKMQEGLKTDEGRVDYVISKLDTDLKVNVTLDNKGNINFQLPKLEDIIPFENLSIFHFSIKPIPKPPTPPPETAEVPNLIGMPEDGAKESIKTAKFKVGAITERTSITTPRTVIEQSPSPYSRTKIGSSIDLVISKVREVKVPNVIGMDRDNAISTISLSKLTVGKITEQISKSPPGTVISQGITADTIVPIETAIDLVIAKPEIVTVPDVVGKVREEAKKLITKAKLKVGVVNERPSRKPQGTVIEQTPKAGKEVSVETSVDLVIAKLEIVNVPNVVEMKKEEAIKVIEGSDLKVGRIREEVSRKLPGRVLEQMPKDGMTVEAGTTIDLIIAKMELVSIPNIIKRSVEEAKRLIEVSKLKVGKIMEKESQELPGYVLEQTPKAKEKVPAETSVDLVIAKPEIVAVPDIVGTRREEATRIIEKVKLKVGAVAEIPSTKPPGTVIDQKPGAGEKIPVGTSVDLTIAKIEAISLTDVPNIIGIPREQAIRVIKSAKLEVGKVMEKPSPKPSDTIIEQTPKAGEKVPVNTLVDVTVSKPS